MLHRELVHKFAHLTRHRKIQGGIAEARYKPNNRSRLTQQSWHGSSGILRLFQQYLFHLVGIAVIADANRYIQCQRRSGK